MTPGRPVPPPLRGPVPLPGDVTDGGQDPDTPGGSVPTLFTRIIDGEIPGRFVWQDDDVVAFLTIAPITPGHTLVVPRREIEHWLEADPDTLTRVMAVAQTVGRAQEQAFGAERVGVLLEGYEMPHLHVHVWPTQSPADFDLHRVDADPDPEAMDVAAESLRSALRDAGHGACVPD